MLEPAIRDPARPVTTLGQRRYLGGKSKLLPQLKALVDGQLGPVASFADLFAGTGVVSQAFNGPDVVTLSNDLLRCNQLILQAFLGEVPDESNRVESLFVHLESLTPRAGYVTETFGGAYFSPGISAQIDAMREEMRALAEAEEITPWLESVALASLLYAADRLANTCGHYDAYRRVSPVEGQIVLRRPDFDAQRNAGNRVHGEDANRIATRLSADVVYLDPPYNSRQYCDTYHVLENIARWEKPQVVGVSRKMDRSQLKSRYCSRVQAPLVLGELVASAFSEWKASPLASPFSLCPFWLISGSCCKSGQGAPFLDGSCYYTC